MAFNLNEVKDWTIPDLLKNQEFRAFCAGMYDSIRPKARTNGLTFFDQELANFRQLYLTNDYLREAKTQSIASAFINIAFYAISIAPVEKAQAYVIPKKGAANEVGLKITGYGELAIRKANGSVQDVMGPILVHDGDSIQTVDGKVHHIGLHKSSKIIGVWARITKRNGKEDDKYFSMEQIQSYRAKSPAKDGYAWTGGPPAPDGTKQPTLGMIEAKVFQHMFDTYQRMEFINENIERMSDEEAVLAQIDGEAIYADAMAKATAPVVEQHPYAPQTEFTIKPDPVPEPTPTISSSIPTFF